MINVPSQFDQKDPRETVLITFDATAMLAAGETLIGTPTISISTQIGQDNPASLVLSNVIINSVPVALLNGKTMAAGCAVQAEASSGAFGSQYQIAAVVTTSNPAKILALKAILPMAAS